MINRFNFNNLDNITYTKGNLEGIFKVFDFKDYNYIMKLFTKIKINRISLSFKPNRICTSKSGKAFTTKATMFIFFYASYLDHSLLFRLSQDGALQFYWGSSTDRILITKKTNRDRFFELLNKKYPIDNNNINLVRKYLKNKCSFNALFLKELSTTNV